MPTSELAVLKPIDSSIADPDDYEIFVLSNAHVVYASNGKSASLLAAYADIPLRVEGKLEAPSRAQLKYRRQPDRGTLQKPRQKPRRGNFI
jgi:hypothetical protein